MGDNDGEWLKRGAAAEVRAQADRKVRDIGSQMGHVGGVNRSLYCASKWALEGMSKALALDLAAHGIRRTRLRRPSSKPR